MTNERLILTDTARHPWARCPLHVWRAFGLVLAMTVLTLLRPTSLTAQTTQDASKLCSLVEPGDLALLLKSHQPAKRSDMGPMCILSLPGEPRSLAIMFSAPRKGQTAEQTFTAMRKMEDILHQGAHDEPGIGDRAYFVPSVDSVFLVLTKGVMISFTIQGSRDVELLRPIVRKVIAGYSK